MGGTKTRAFARPFGLDSGISPRGHARQRGVRSSSAEGAPNGVPNMHEVTAVACLLPIVFAESLARTAADPNAHLFPAASPVEHDQDGRKTVWWSSDRTDEKRHKQSLENMRTVARTNQGIFSDCFGATVDKGSPLEEMIYSGSKICWQTLCSVPNAADEGSNDANARPNWSASGLPKRRIPTSRFPTKLEKLFLRPLEEDDWGDFQLCLLVNLNVFDAVSISLSADSLKSILYATNATFGNHTIMAEFVDYCLGQAHREASRAEGVEKSPREVVTRKRVTANPETTGDAERWVPPGHRTQNESTRPEKFRVESKKQNTERRNLKAMYKKFTQCFREQVKIACYVPDALMLTPELSDRSEFLYSLLPRPRRFLDLEQKKSRPTRLIDGGKDAINKTVEGVENPNATGTVEETSAKMAQRAGTIIIKRRFLNKVPNNYHGYPDLVDLSGQTEFPGQKGTRPWFSAPSGTSGRKPAAHPLPPWATTTEGLTMVAPRPTSSWLATLTGEEQSAGDGQGGPGVFNTAPTTDRRSFTNRGPTLLDSGDETEGGSPLTPTTRPLWSPKRTRRPTTAVTPSTTTPKPVTRTSTARAATSWTEHPYYTRAPTTRRPTTQATTTRPYEPPWNPRRIRVDLCQLQLEDGR